MAKETKKPYNLFTLGTSIVKFNLPMEFVDDINKAYDENSEDLKSHNDKLAGKIQEEKKINEILTPSMNNTFKCVLKNT